MPVEALEADVPTLGDVGKRAAEAQMTRLGEKVAWIGCPSGAVLEARRGVRALVEAKTRQLKRGQVLATMGAALAVSVPLSRFVTPDVPVGVTTLAMVVSAVLALVAVRSTRAAGKVLRLHHAFRASFAVQTYAVSDTALYVCETLGDGAVKVTRFDASAIFQVELDHEEDILIHAGGAQLVLPCLPDAAAAYGFLEPFGRRVTRSTWRG